MTEMATTPRMARLQRQQTTGDVVAALAESIATAPRLDGAACKGSDQWDAEILPEAPADREDRLIWAATICRTGCPAFDACAEWFAGLPDAGRPDGVIAGRVTSTRGRRRHGGPQRQGWAEPAAADAWLADYLRAHGRTPAGDVRAASVMAGIKPRTLRLAVTRLGVLRTGSPVCWHLPDAGENARDGPTQPRQPASSTTTTTEGDQP